jgi:hypothetical protein
MSLDYRALNTFPLIKTFSASTSNTEILVPANASFMTVQSPSHKIFVATDGTDGGAPSAHRVEITSGGSMELRLAKGSNRQISIFIATNGASSADINLVFEE